MEEKPRRRSLLLTLLAMPLVLGIMVPLAVLFAVVFYGLALLGVLRYLIAALLFRKSPLKAEPLQKPHFLEARIQVKDMPGEKHS
jgi:hypothetical protein